MNGLDSIVINFPQVQLWQSVTSIKAPSPRGAVASPPPPACGWRLRAALSPSPAGRRRLRSAAPQRRRLCGRGDGARPPHGLPGREARGPGAGRGFGAVGVAVGALGTRPRHAGHRPSRRPRARPLRPPGRSGGLRAQAAEAGHLRVWRPSLCAPAPSRAAALVAGVAAVTHVPAFAAAELLLNGTSRPSASRKGSRTGPRKEKLWLFHVTGK